MTSTLRSERCRLRLPDLGDAESIASFYRLNAAHFSNYLNADPPGIGENAYWIERIPSILDDASHDRAYKYFVFLESASAPIGFVSLFNVVRGAFHACYRGYRVDRDFEGKGLMSEAVRAAIAHAFGPLSLHRIMANYAVGNERSGSLLQRLGFEIEGTARAYLFVNGRWMDHVLTSKTNDLWNGVGLQLASRSP